MIIAGYSKKEIQDIITNNTFSGVISKTEVRRLEKDIGARNESRNR